MPVKLLSGAACVLIAAAVGAVYVLSGDRPEDDPAVGAAVAVAADSCCVTGDC